MLISTSKPTHLLASSHAALLGKGHHMAIRTTATTSLALLFALSGCAYIEQPNPTPEATVTVTKTVTAEPEPAPTVTVTKTVTADPVAPTRGEPAVPSSSEPARTFNKKLKVEDAVEKEQGYTRWSTNTIGLGGTKHADAFTTEIGGGKYWVDFLRPEAATHLSLAAGIADESPASDYVVEVTVLDMVNDDVLISQEVTVGKPLQMEIDVQGLIRVRIHMKTIDRGHKSGVALAGIAGAWISR